MLRTAIKVRRAYRALKPVEISQNQIEEIIEFVKLAPSCFNNQPWRFIFVQNEKLKEIYPALNNGNSWAKNGSMIVAVFSKSIYDCQIKEREPYFMFDTGMATAYLILLLTELGLVAHPIAGFDPTPVKETLRIPADMTLITLLVVGKRTSYFPEEMNEKQRNSEEQRPLRKKTEEIAFFNSYTGK
ncbi:MAG: nitroreductase family protein [Candidatus Heimdallarchaeota archaeon]|nr:nitroreductase family protein [Candidatus Heimdallarchaeota archaeon]